MRDDDEGQRPGQARAHPPADERSGERLVQRLGTEGGRREPGQGDADLDGGEEAVGVGQELAAAPRRGGPVSDRARTWDSRSEISAISVPEKKPPIRTKTTTMTMLSQTSLTGGALLGVFGWGSLPHGAWSAAGTEPTAVAAPRGRRLAGRDVSLGDFR